MLTQGKKGLITITELKSLGFTLNYGHSAPDNSDKIVTKQEAITSYNLAPAPLKDYTLNQLPPEEAFQSGPDCTGCTSYDITITQADIDLSDDHKVYVYYYACGGYTGETLDYMSFAYSGTYKSYICVQNCAGILPYVGYLYDGGVATTAQYGSNINPLAGNCGNVTLSCGGAPFTYTVSNSGFNYVNTHIDLSGQTYGNVEVSISCVALNSNNEIFIGNFDEKYGKIYSFGLGPYVKPSSGDTIGFYSEKGKTDLDIVIHSTHTGGSFDSYPITFQVSCPSCVTCAPSTTGTTLVSGTTLNVTKTGYIRYNISENESVDVNITQLGTYTISTCIIYGSVRAAIPRTPSLLATYNNVVYGSECSISTSGTVSTTFTTDYGYGTDIFWIDGNGNDRKRFIYYKEVFTACALYGSASGQNAVVTYSNICTPATDPTPTNNWNQYNISTTSHANCGDACDATLNSLIYSRARSVNELYNYPIFSDTEGTTFVGTGNYYRVYKTDDAGYGYSVSIDEYGVATDIHMCKSLNPGVCEGNL